MLGGTVVTDTNENGVTDPGERGLAGVSVEIGGGVPGQRFSRTTDANSRFSFGSIPVGRYGVSITAPACGDNAAKRTRTQPVVRP